MSASAQPFFLKDYRPQSKLKVAGHALTRPKFDAIDAHAHFGDLYCPIYAQGKAWQPWSVHKIGDMVERLRRMGIAQAVNLDGFWDGFLGLTMKQVFDALAPWKDFFCTFVSVDTRAPDAPDFTRNVRDHFARAKDLGARGVKLFKHLSLMVEKGPYEFVPGRGLLPDDPRLDVIWDSAAQLRLPVLIHIADPPAFFDPVDGRNSRYLELLEHPDWSYFGSGGYGYDELMRAQERLLENHPNTRFIIPHVGSAAEDLGFVAACLERFPNLSIDLAARLGELGRQPYSAKALMERFSDRVLFGTDAYPDDRLLQRYQSYFRFLETYDEDIGGGGLIGVGLGDAVLEKVYRQNAARILGVSG